MINSQALELFEKQGQFQDSVEEVWSKVLEQVHESGFNPVAYSSWIAPLIPYSLDETNFVLLAKNNHVQSTVLSRYINKITGAAKQVLGRDLKVVVLLDSEVSEGSAPKIPEVSVSGTNLKSKYRFENFVKGKCNEFALAAAEAVAERPGSLYNPLFLHGDVGLGKTHLIHSIGNHVLHNDPKAKILYTTSENLVNEFVSSIRNRKNQEFRDKYRTVDVLLVDDIQFLSDKEGTQEEFFHTFNVLHSDNKQVILTSDKPPFELKSLEDRLRSRFSSGLTVDITMPDLETRIAILEKKAETERINVDSKVLYYIAKSVPSNIRELEGALNTVAARAKLTNAACTVEFTEQTLSDMINQRERREIDVEYIQEVVAAYYGVPADEIRGKKRLADYTHARHVAMYLSRMIIDKPLKNIGKDFGGRDHSTIIHACDKISAELEENKKLKKEVGELEKKIKGE